MSPRREKRDCELVFRLSPAFVREAGKVLREYGPRHGLRTLDALHLAGFSMIAEKNWAFVTADANQTAVGRLMGCEVWNPLEREKITDNHV